MTCTAGPPYSSGDSSRKPASGPGDGARLPEFLELAARSARMASETWM
jgi:hypothetical protein